MPNGFARSTAGEYTSNMFWIVGIALVASWIVAVVFTPYLGVRLLPDIKKVEGGHHAIYDTPTYNRFRRLLGRVIQRKWLVAAAVVGVFVVAVVGMGSVRKQFFPTSDRPEVLVDVQLPYGSSIEETSGATKKVEAWLAKQSEAKIVTSYIGQGAPRFFLPMSPELPDPSFAKIVVLTGSEEEREALKVRLRRVSADGLAPEARVRVSQLVFGPNAPFPVAYRITGPEPSKLREIAADARKVLQDDPMMRTANIDWGDRTPTLHFSLQQDRLQARRADVDRRFAAAPVSPQGCSHCGGPRGHSIGPGGRAFRRTNAARPREDRGLHPRRVGRSARASVASGDGGAPNGGPDHSSSGSISDHHRAR
jgi:multidrug efflux pump subunit AcrB